MKLAVTVLVSVMLVAAFASDADAQLHLVSVAPASFSFPAADPDVSPIVAGPQLTITYKVAGNPNNGWSMTIQATDLTSAAGDVIPASNVTWVASPAPPFIASGTLSTTAQRLAGDPNAHAAGSQTGFITFSLRNLWTYKAGNYTQTITFTVSSP